jgi:hypothetical protein
MNLRALGIVLLLAVAGFALFKTMELRPMAGSQAVVAADAGSPPSQDPPSAVAKPNQLKGEVVEVGESQIVGTLADAGPGKKWKSPMEQHGYTHEDFKIPIPFVPPTKLPFDRAAVGDVKPERLEGSYDIREKLVRSVQRVLVYGDTLERELVAAKMSCARAAAALLRAGPLWADVNDSYNRDEWKPDGKFDDVGFFLGFDKKYRHHLVAMFDRLEKIVEPIDKKCKGTEPFESAMKGIF